MPSPNRSRSLSALLVAALAASALAASTLAASAAAAHAQSADSLHLAASADKSVNFLIVGDWGHAGEGFQRLVAAQMAAAVKARKADFIVSVGDLFYPDGVASVDDPQWRASFEDVYSQFSLYIPWYGVLGNHEYRGNPQAIVDYSKRARRWRIPSRYYDIKMPVSAGVTAEFLYIDTSPFVAEYRAAPGKYDFAATDTAKQRRWIDSTLRASKAQWKFIVGHHNVYSGGKRTVVPEMERLLNPLMQKYGVAAYFCGHEHHLEHIVPLPGGPSYFISGAGYEASAATGTAGTRFVNATAGFMAATLTADSMSVQVVDYAGKLLYQTNIRR